MGAAGWGGGRRCEERNALGTRCPPRDKLNLLREKTPRVPGHPRATEEANLILTPGFVCGFLAHVLRVSSPSAESRSLVFAPL